MAYVADLLKGSLSSTLTDVDLSFESALRVNRVHLQSWFDSRANRFFKIYPEALGIEIAGAISTRFHRLSLHSDWPRFSWTLLCESTLAGNTTAVLPATDGFAVETSEAYQFSSSVCEKALKHAICLLIAGETNALDEQGLTQLMNALQPLSLQGVSIELLLSLESKKLLRMLPSTAFRVLEWADLNRDDATTTKPLFSFLSTQANTVCAAHIKLLPTIR